MSLAFDPHDPFPLLPEGTVSYAHEQAHARAADAWLGLRSEEIESRLAQARANASRPSGASAWVGLGVDALQTPYTELRRMLEQLRPEAGSTLVDLGAGYGRLGFVLARHFPATRFLGYELLPERAHEGERCLQLFQQAGSSASMKVADLADPAFQPEPADFYFLYDFGSREAIAKCLGDLRAVARTRAITVVGRARASRDAIERGEPWLSQVIPPHHCGHYSIYRSA